MGDCDPTTAYQMSFPPLPGHGLNNAKNSNTKFPNTIFSRKLQRHAPNSMQILGLLTLLISATTLLFLIATGLGLIIFMPLVLISSPIWIPIAIVLVLSIVGFLSVCGVGAGGVAALSWLFQYFRGLHPIGSDKVDYARNRIAYTATHVKDYAKVCGGCLQSKAKKCSF